MKNCLRCGKELPKGKRKYCNNSCKFWYKQIHKPVSIRNNKAQQLRVDRAAKNIWKKDVRYN